MSAPPGHKYAFEEFKFKLLCQLQIFPTENTIEYKTPTKLVAAANKYGLIFVGDPKGIQCIQTNSIINLQHERLNNRGKIMSYPRREVQLPGCPTHLDINCEGELLAVATSQQNCPILVVYSIESFGSPAIAKRSEVRLSSTPGVRVTDIHWNPSIVNMIGAVMSDGSAVVCEFTANGPTFNKIPTQSQSTCLCWSPKGKRVVIGSLNGSLMQYMPDLKVVKAVPPLLIQGKNMGVISVRWLSNTQYIAAYKDVAYPSSNPVVVIINSQGQNPNFINYEDLCCGALTERPDHFFIHQPLWNIIIIGTGNALETAVMKLEGDSWIQWIMDDGNRADLPLTNDHQEVYNIGMSLDLSSQVPVPIEESKTINPVPILLMLSHAGVLCLFHTINSSSTASNLNVTPHNLPSHYFSEKATEPQSSPPPQPQLGQEKPQFSMPNFGLSTQPSLLGSQPFSGFQLSQQLTSQQPTPQQQQSTQQPLVSQQPAPQPQLVPQQPQPAPQHYPATTQPQLKFQLPQPTLGQSSLLLQPPPKIQTPAMTVLQTPVSTPPQQMQAVAQLSKPENSSIMQGLNPGLTVGGFQSSFTLSPPQVDSQLNKSNNIFGQVVPTSTSDKQSSAGLGLNNKTSDALNNTTGFGFNFDNVNLQKTSNLRSTIREDSNKTEKSLGLLPTPSLQKKDNIPGGVTVQSKDVLHDEKIMEHHGDKVEREKIILESINQEITNVEKKFIEFRKKINKIDIASVDKLVLNTISLKVNDLEKFEKDLSEATSAQLAEVNALRCSLVEVYGWMENIKAKDRQVKSQRYVECLESQTLDPIVKRHLKSLEQHKHFLESQVKQATSRLDSMWAIHNSTKNKNTLNIPNLEAIYEAIVNQSYILAAQKTIVNEIESQLRRSLNKYKRKVPPVIQYSTPKLNTKFKNNWSPKTTGAELDILADKLLNTKINQDESSQSFKETSSRYIVLANAKKNLDPLKENCLKQWHSSHKVINTKAPKPYNTDDDILFKPTKITEVPKGESRLKEESPLQVLSLNSNLPQTVNVTTKPPQLAKTHVLESTKQVVQPQPKTATNRSLFTISDANQTFVPTRPTTTVGAVVNSSIGNVVFFPQSNQLNKNDQKISSPPSVSKELTVSSTFKLGQSSSIFGTGTSNFSFANVESVLNKDSSVVQPSSTVTLSPVTSLSQTPKTNPVVASGLSGTPATTPALAKPAQPTPDAKSIGASLFNLGQLSFSSPSSTNVSTFVTSSSLNWDTPTSTGLEFKLSGNTNTPSTLIGTAVTTTASISPVTAKSHTYNQFANFTPSSEVSIFSIKSAPNTESTTTVTTLTTQNSALNSLLAAPTSLSTTTDNSLKTEFSLNFSNEQSLDFGNLSLSTNVTSSSASIPTSSIFSSTTPSSVSAITSCVSAATTTKNVFSTTPALGGSTTAVFPNSSAANAFSFDLKNILSTSNSTATISTNSTSLSTNNLTPSENVITSTTAVTTATTNTTGQPFTTTITSPSIKSNSNAVTTGTSSIITSGSISSSSAINQPTSETTGLGSSTVSSSTTTSSSFSSESSFLKNTFTASPKPQTSIFSSTSTFASGTPFSTSVFGETQAKLFGSTTVTTTAQTLTTVTTAAAAETQSLFGNITSSTLGFGSQTTPSSSLNTSNTNTSAPAITAPTTASSVFGSPALPVSNTTSIFGAANTAVTSATSIFGNVNSTVSNSNTSVFGATTPSTPSTTTSLFGGTTTPAIFGTPTATTTTSSIFGSAPTATPSTMFGAAASTPPSSSVFESAQANSTFFGIPSTSTSSFGSTATTSPFMTQSRSFSTPFFQNTTPTTNVFSTPEFGQKPATTTPGSIFGGAPTFGQSGGNLFGNTASTNNFAPNTGSVFGNNSTFGTPSTQQNSFTSGQTGGSLFGSATPNAFSGGQQNVGQSVFGGSATFGASGASMFGGQATFGSSPTFGGSATFSSPKKVFGEPATGASTFGSPTQQSSTFENLAGQNTLTFGNLAQNQQTAAFTTNPTFGTPTSQQPFPAASSFGGSSFSNWR